ncbi:MAG: ATP-binding protein [Chloroflexi bacterium]|nr:ATP-binding protein [Chloroflexota bacterium]
MEHISEILRKQTRTNISKASTDTSFGAEPAEASPESVCHICKGARFVHPLLPSGKPDFSRVVPCRCTQQELGEERRARLQRYSNLGSLTRFIFDNLLPQGKSENPVNRERFNLVYQAAKTFASEPKGWLVLTGPSGSGKTHLAAAIANYCIARNQPAFYITAPDLLDHLRSSFSPDSEMPYDEFFEQVRNAPLLILDDLGAQSSTPWAKEKLEQLLNHRFSNQLPTVIVSIVPVDELEDRIRTRLLAANFYQLGTDDGKAQMLFTSSWAPEFELQKTMIFDNFDQKRANLPPEQRENLKEAYDIAFDFARSPDGWLLFQGVNGCGKTHLAAAIVNYRYQHKQPALFIVVPDFLDHLRSSFSPDSKISYDRLFEGVKSVPLLVLDDFGAQATTPWAQEKLYQVINHRYNARLATVITTNSSLEEMENRISSRLADTKICLSFNIMAPHYRSDVTSHKRVPRSVKKGY